MQRNQRISKIVLDISDIRRTLFRYNSRHPESTDNRGEQLCALPVVLRLHRESSQSCIRAAQFTFLLPEYEFLAEDVQFFGQSLLDMDVQQSDG